MSECRKTGSPRKQLGAENSRTRAALIEAAATLIREEGCAAVTAQKVAGKAGLKHQVIYYYFNTLEDLILEVLRRGVKRSLAHVNEALASDQPVRALWESMSKLDGGSMHLEFRTLAIHNEAIRAEIVRYADETRQLQATALAKHFQDQGIDPPVSPLLLTVRLTGVARLLDNESRLGIKVGHREAEAMVETFLRQFEQRGKAVQDRKARSGVS